MFPRFVFDARNATRALRRSKLTAAPGMRRRRPGPSTLHTLVEPWRRRPAAALRWATARPRRRSSCRRCRSGRLGHAKRSGGGGHEHRRGGQSAVCGESYGGDDNAVRRRERLIAAGYGNGTRSFADGVVQGTEGGWTASAIDGYGTTPGQLGALPPGTLDTPPQPTTPAPVTTWQGCYSDGWQDLIVPEAFAHPAKFARGLIHRIYRHLLERGYVRPGDDGAGPVRRRGPRGARMP